MPDETSLHVTGWGTAQADVASIAGLRKAIPAWAPADTPGHFLKHADEQTVVAVAAVDAAIRAHQFAPEELAEWAVVAAPQSIGRISGASTFARFTKSGGPAVSPHLIPQSSLHSVSGALSILLGTRHPNCGVGGGDDALAEGILVALTMPPLAAKGIWLIATAWDPEPILNDALEITNAPRCYAAALALEVRAASGSFGRVSLVCNGSNGIRHRVQDSPDLNHLCRGLESLPAAGATFAWSLPGGGTLVLEAKPRAATWAAAA